MQQSLFAKIPREIDIVKCLASQSFAIDKEEDALTTETSEVEVSLLVHSIGEFYARHLLSEQVFTEVL